MAQLLQLFHHLILLFQIILRYYILNYFLLIWWDNWCRIINFWWKVILLYWSNNIRCLWTVIEFYCKGSIVWGCASDNWTFMSSICLVMFKRYISLRKLNSLMWTCCNWIRMMKKRGWSNFDLPNQLLLWRRDGSIYRNTLNIHINRRIKRSYRNRRRMVRNNRLMIFLNYFFSVNKLIWLIYIFHQLWLRKCFICCIYSNTNVWLTKPIPIGKIILSAQQIYRCIFS